jgi:hypothetical protein
LELLRQLEVVWKKPQRAMDAGQLFLNFAEKFQVYAVYCLADDHELLTNEGFKSVEELRARWDGERFTSGLTVATYEASTSQLVYQPASAFVYNEPRQQNMVEIAWGERGLLVTPNHDMYMQSVDSDVMTKKSAGTLLFRNAGHEKMLLHCSNGLQPSFDWRLLEPVRLLGLSSFAQLESFLYVFGWWIGRDDGVDCDEGYVFRCTHIGDAEWLCKQLDVICVPWRTTTYDAVYVMDDRMHRLFPQSRLHPFPAWVWDLPMLWARLLLYGISVGSGVERRPYKRYQGMASQESSEQQILRTTSAHTRDGVVRLAAHAG